jgi:hypothetical protein
LSNYVPVVDVPDPDEVRAAIVVPEVPAEVPAAGRFLAQSLQPPRPWEPDLLNMGGPTPPLAPLGPAHE